LPAISAAPTSRPRFPPAKQSAALSSQQQQQNLADVNAEMAVGLVDQQTSQRNLDHNQYQQFLASRNFGKDQLNFLNSIIRGTPSNSTTTTEHVAAVAELVLQEQRFGAGLCPRRGRFRPCELGMASAQRTKIPKIFPSAVG